MSDHDRGGDMARRWAIGIHCFPRSAYANLSETTLVISWMHYSEAKEPSMACIRDKPFERRRHQWLVQGVFFAAIFAYVCFLIRPHLIYDAFGVYVPYPEFSMDWTCLRQGLSRAAGLTQYVCAGLSQWFYYSYSGALIVTAVAWLICLATNRLIRRMGETTFWFLSLFPACAVLVLYQTCHHPLAPLLALTLCLWLAVGYEAMPDNGNATLRTALFLAFCFGLYYLAGTVSLLFGLLVGTWYACAGRRLVRGGAMIVASAIVPWLTGTRLFHMTIDEAHSLVWPFATGSASDMESLPINVLRCLFLFPFVILLVVAFCQFLRRRQQRRPPAAASQTLDRDSSTSEYGKLHNHTRRSGNAPAAARRQKARALVSSLCGGRGIRVVGQVLALAAAAMAIHHFFRAPHREKRFEMVHFARDGKWDQVLNVARQVPNASHDCFYRHLVNRSLFHTGRLGDDMFSFSQDRAGLLLLTNDVPHGPPKFWMLSEIALEMGDVNLAEQWAFETLEAVGDCPSALETLALICTAKRQYEAARVVLKRMEKDVIHGRRASKLLGLLDQVLKAKAPWLQEAAKVRTLMCADDSVFQAYSEERMLESLLHANPSNRMAFEYLMAFYLLTKRTDKVVKNLYRLDDFGYKEIPRHYEEAILIQGGADRQSVPLHGRRIRRATIDKFNAFVHSYRRWGNQRHLALGALAGDFGDTYFFYHVFGAPGAGGSR